MVREAYPPTVQRLRCVHLWGLSAPVENPELALAQMLLPQSQASATAPLRLSTAHRPALRPWPVDLILVLLHLIDLLLVLGRILHGIGRCQLLYLQVIVLFMINIRVSITICVTTLSSRSILRALELEMTTPSKDNDKGGG